MRDFPIVLSFRRILLDFEIFLGASWDRNTASSLSADPDVGGVEGLSGDGEARGVGVMGVLGDWLRRSRKSCTNPLAVLPSAD